MLMVAVASIDGSQRKFGDNRISDDGIFLFYIEEKQND